MAMFTVSKFIFLTIFRNALVNVNPHPGGISGDLSIEQARGSGGLKIWLVFFIVVDKLSEL